MSNIRKKVAGTPLGKKGPVKMIFGTPSTEKPIGPEGKTLTPPPRPDPAPYRRPQRKAGQTIVDYWAGIKASEK